LGDENTQPDDGKGDENTYYDEDKHRKVRLRTILLTTVPTFIVFLVINIFVISIPNSVILYFDGTDSKYSTLEGTLSILSSNEGLKNTLHLSLTSGKANLLISSSNLYDTKSNDSIKSNEITFDSQVSLPLNNVSSNPKDINIKVNGNHVGTFQGALNIVSQNTTSIPIIVDVKPNFTKVAIWAINGIVASVVALNIAGYWFLERKHHKTKQQISKFLKYFYFLSAEREEIKDIEIEIPHTMLEPSLSRIVCILEDSNPNYAFNELKNLEHSYCEIYNLESLKKIKNRSLASLKTTPFAKTNHRFKKNLNSLLSYKTDFSLRKYSTTSIIEKNVISGIIGVAFGIIIGFIPLLQNDYIISLRAMGITDYLILFGLGVGIGNLNEGISKIWEKPKGIEEK